MNPIRRLALRLRAILARRALERDMQAEMRDHVDQATERLIARGLSPADARLAAKREFGNATVLHEQARDARGARWVDALASDLLFAFRYFARQPLTTGTIIVVLALGIGANSALFAAIQAEVLRPAPAVPKDAAHARIYGLEQPRRGTRWQVREFSYPELGLLAERKETFSSVAGWIADDVVLDPADSTSARGVGAEFVTPNFFAALGVPITGPGFAAPDPTTPDLAAVISFSMAEELFDAPASAIGKRVLVNQVPVRIVGVAPPRFQGAIPNSGRPVLWMPLSARADIDRLPPRWLADSAHLSVFARLAPSVTREQATAVARIIAPHALPDSAARIGMAHSASVVGMRESPPIQDDESFIVFTAIGVIALLILLVACTNVSSLLVAAAVGRRHEIAVRLSLGASRARLVRQLLTESALLALVGGTGGLLLYWWFTKLIGSRVNVEVAPDLTTVAFTLAFALGTGILFGLSPALHATRDGVAGAIRDSGTGATRRSRLQRSFVIAQIVFSQPLLVILAVLLWATVGERDPGPSAVSEYIVSARFRFPSRLESPNQSRQAVDSLVPRIAALPGVVAVTPDASAFALRNVTPVDAVASSDRTSADPISVNVEGTPPGYFALLDVPIVLGRDVSLADTLGNELRVVIGSDLARRVWGNQSPIGKKLVSGDVHSGARDSTAMVVVGVFDASKPTTRGGHTRVYTASGKLWRSYSLLIRTRGPAQAFIPQLRTALQTTAPALPISRLETLATISARDRRVALQVIGAAATAGGLALLLASLGLYGVISLAISQRKREIGIRIAVGAMPSRVVRMFLASGVRMSAIALLLGLPVSLVALRIALSQGIVIAPGMNLWLVGSAIAAILLVVACAATWLPARRAAQVDPALTLRVE
jgi:predicted permease